MSCNRKAEARSTRSGRLRLTMRGPPWVMNSPKEYLRSESAAHSIAVVRTPGRHSHFVPETDIIYLSVRSGKLVGG
jgi:hypothetical protein